MKNGREHFHLEYVVDRWESDWVLERELLVMITLSLLEM